MSRRVVVLVSLVCVWNAPAQARGDAPKVADQVRLTVVPATKALYVGDALLIKIVLENKGKESIWLKNGFEGFTYGVRAEVSAPRTTEFKKARLVGVGLFCGFCRKLEVPAGTSIVCYEHLFAPFSSAGKWRVRAETKIYNEEIRSEPVEVSVETPPKRIEEALDWYPQTISHALRNWWATDAETKTRLEARDLLGGSEAGGAIRQACLLRELSVADSAKARELAMTAVEKHRDGLRGVAREYFDLQTVKVLIDRKEYAEATKILDAIPDRSHAIYPTRPIQPAPVGERK